MSEENLPNLNIRINKKQSETSKHNALPQLLLKQRQHNSGGQKQQYEAPPASAPAYQEQDRYHPAQGKFRLGRDTQTRDYVDVPQASRREGLYLIGIQGTGKTGLIENLIIQDIKQGVGVGLLDPHGDLTHAVLSRLPDRRVKDVIYLDLTDYRYPFGINLFECSDLTNPMEVQKTVDQVMHVFEKIYGVSRDTPLILDYLRNCTYTLIANPGYTMAEIPLLLLNTECRRKLVANVDDIDVRHFWQQYEHLKPGDQNEQAAYIRRRVSEFLLPLSRSIVGQSTSTIDLQSIMNEGKILLVKLSTQLSSVTNLIGSILIALILNAAANRPANKRRQFNLYADEFQRFATEDFATLLEEARKFGIATTIAHQNRSQLESRNEQLETNLKDRTRSVANLVVFRVNSKDADDLAGEFNITPQEAWEEEIEPQWHERVEEQVADEAEEDIMEITQNPVDYLVGVRGSHGSAKVREATQVILIPLVKAAQAKSTRLPNEGELDYRSPFIRYHVFYPSQYTVVYGPLPPEGSLVQGERLINSLLVDVMEGRIELNTAEFFVAIEDIVVTLAGFIGWFGFTREGTYGSSYRAGTSGHAIRIDAEPLRTMSHIELNDSLREALFSLLYEHDSIHKQEYQQDFTDKLFGEFNSLSGHTVKEKVRTLAEEATVSVVSFAAHLRTLCYTLRADPIRVPTGQKRLVPKYRTHLTYHTIPAKTILHPQRTYADVLKQVASELTNLDNFMARVRIKNADERLVEYTIRTLDPKQQPERPLFGQAMQARLDSIKEQNIQNGYLRERATVEKEIRQRQEQCNQPPEEEPPIYRR